jgi:hypothetical protein
MSQPFTSKTARNVSSEIISAESSLNMYPERIKGAEGYLSAVDKNAAHAMEHLRAAFAASVAVEQALEVAHGALIRCEHANDGHLKALNIVRAALGYEPLPF